MKIKQCKKTVLFQDIEDGDVFKIGNTLYIKIKIISGCNAINLNENAGCFIGYEHPIEIVECELVVR